MRLLGGLPAPLKGGGGEWPGMAIICSDCRDCVVQDGDLEGIAKAARVRNSSKWASASVKAQQEEELKNNARALEKDHGR